MSTVRSAPIGVIPPGAVERAFIGMLYAGVLGLSFLSVLGTFYGASGRAMPLDIPHIAADIAAAPWWALGALIYQSSLTCAQWGTHQLAKRRDRRWWLGYFAVLLLSAYYNLTAFYAPMLAVGTPSVVAGLLILIGDAIPELVAVKT